ncbi:MAG: iron-containing alcohol dehydrogenase [Syntrophobacterales bacterium]|nr:MAG: iron-containing alcohol dehydrogenase [Syntrophobacterales bacterium]
MMIPYFQFISVPRIIFGAGTVGLLAGEMKKIGGKALVVTGGSSLEKSGSWGRIEGQIQRVKIACERVSVSGETSPELIDEAVAALRGTGVTLVLSIGGGSVIDAGKALAAMMTQNCSVTEFMEGIGGREQNGAVLPHIAVPTTSGTGSEATKNAVLSHVGPDGYKRSIRHDNFIPDLAVVDPELVLPCPAGVTAATGLDACTQLLESYVSLKASPMTDALALSGLGFVGDSLLLACGEGAGDTAVRAAMAYGSLMSGICLANAGLGVVHGLAASIGGMFDIPHGIVCGTLLGTATEETIGALRERGRESVALEKYARVGALFAGREYRGRDRELLCDRLIEILHAWIEELDIPRLRAYGVLREDGAGMVQKTGNKNNPVALTTAEIERLVMRRLE